MDYTTLISYQNTPFPWLGIAGGIALSALLIAFILHSGYFSSAKSSSISVFLGLVAIWGSIGAVALSTPSPTSEALNISHSTTADSSHFLQHPYVTDYEVAEGFSSDVRVTRIGDVTERDGKSTASVLVSGPNKTTQCKVTFGAISGNVLEMSVSCPTGADWVKP